MSPLLLNTHPGIPCLTCCCVYCTSCCASQQGIVVFKIDDQEWTLDLRPGQGSLLQGPPPEKADITLTIRCLIQANRCATGSSGASRSVWPVCPQR